MQYSVVSVRRNNNSRNNIVGYFISPVINGRIDTNCIEYFSHDYILKEVKAKRMDITNLEYRKNTNSLHSRENFIVDSQLDREQFYNNILGNANSYFNNFELPKECLNKLLCLIERSERNHKVLQSDYLFGVELCNIIDNFFEYLHPVKYREKEAFGVKNILKKDINDKTLCFKENTNRYLSSDVGIYNNLGTSYRNNSNGILLLNNGNDRPNVYSVFVTSLQNMWGMNKILPNKSHIKSVIKVLKKYFNNIRPTNIGSALYYEYIKELLNKILELRNQNWNGRISAITLNDNIRYNIVASKVVGNSIIAKNKNTNEKGLNRFKKQGVIKKKQNKEHDKFIERINGELNPIDLETSAALQGIINLTPTELKSKSSQYKLDSYIDLYYKHVKNLYDTVYTKIKCEDKIITKSIDVKRTKYELGALLNYLSKGSLESYINKDIKGSAMDISSELAEDYCKGLFNENLAEIIKNQKLDLRLITPNINLLDMSVDKLSKVYMFEILPYVKKRISNLNREVQRDSIVNRFNALNKVDRDIIMYYVCLMLYTRQIQTKSGLNKVTDDLKPLLSYCISKDINESSYSVYRFRKSEAAWLITYLLINEKLSGIKSYDNSYHTVYYRLFKYVYRKISSKDYIDNVSDLSSLKNNYKWNIRDEQTFPINVINLF